MIYTLFRSPSTSTPHPRPVLSNQYHIDFVMAGDITAVLINTEL